MVNKVICKKKKAPQHKKEQIARIVIIRYLCSVGHAPHPLHGTQDQILMQSTIDVPELDPSSKYHIDGDSEANYGLAVTQE